MRDERLTDRRSVLRKAATAGAIVWAAPTILSSRVSAVDFLDGVCTAKCAAQFPGGTALTVRQLCFAPDPTDVVEIVGTAFHDCPCRGTGVFTVSAHGWGNSIRVRSLTPTTLLFDLFTPDTFYEGFVDYVATCFDRQSNPIERVLSFAVSFTTLPDPCTIGFETTISASEGTPSAPTCNPE